jgi:hypothetical protein
LRRIGRIRCARSCTGKGTCQSITGDRQEIRYRKEFEFSTQEIALVRLDIELIDETLDEENIDRATDGDDAVGAC